MNIDGINQFGSLTTKTGKVLKFEDFDLDKDGKISRGEYNVVLKDNGLDVVELSNVDTNHNESLSEDEFAFMEQKIEMQKAVNDMLGQISTDFSGENSKHIQDVLKQLKDYINDFANNYGRGYDINEMSVKFKEQLPAKYNEIKNNLLVLNFNADDFALNYIYSSFDFDHQLQKHGISTFGPGNKSYTHTEMQTFLNTDFKNIFKSIFADNLKQKGISFEPFEELFDKVYTTSIYVYLGNNPGSEFDNGDLRTVAHCFNNDIKMAINDLKAEKESGKNQDSADFYPVTTNLFLMSDYHDPFTHNSEADWLARKKDVMRSEFIRLIYTDTKKTTNVSLYKTRNTFTDLFDKAFDETLKEEHNFDFEFHLRCKLERALNEWNIANAPKEEPTAQAAVPQAEEAPTLNNEQISEIRSRVIENLYNEMINTAESLSPEQKKAYGKELEAIADGFIEIYHGNNLELDLTAYIQEAMNLSDAKRLSSRAEEFLSIAESTGNYIDSNEFAKLKEKTSAFLKHALSNGVTIELGDVQINSESDIEVAIAQYEDGDVLIADMKKALSNLSTASKLDEIANADNKAAFAEIESEELAVYASELDGSRIDKIDDEDEVKKEDAGKYIKEYLSQDNLKSQMKAQIKAKMEAKGIPFDKIADAFENVFEQSIDYIVNICNAENNTLMRNFGIGHNIGLKLRIDNLMLLNSFVNLFNQNMAYTINSIKETIS